MFRSLCNSIMERYYEINLEDKLQRLSFQDPHIILSNEEIKFIRKCYHIKSEGYPNLARDYMDKYKEWRKEYFLRMIDIIERGSNGR